MSRFVLVDCNNFFVSCERLFRPDLEKRPVVVLSSNDGCVVSRSQEAKALGIAMGIPFFEIRHLCALHNVEVCSSNFGLYGDLSSRVMQLLRESAPRCEVYSIDEAFLEFEESYGLKELSSICSGIRRKVAKWVGISTSIGIGPTKTLAKIATGLAKKERVFGVTDLCRKERRREVLSRLGIGEVWGVGPSLERQFLSLGVTSALEATMQDIPKIRERLGVVGLRIVLELIGESCLPLQEVQMRKSIIRSRSFSAALSNVEDISYALCTHVSSAVLQLRKEGLCAAKAEPFIVDKDRQYYAALELFSPPTDDSMKIIGKVRKMLLTQLHQEGRSYKKCGIMLYDFMPKDQVPLDLFSHPLRAKSDRLMSVIDGVNQRFGHNTLFYAAAGSSEIWRPTSLFRSGGFDDFPLVRA
jgi:DNA polymerase V